MLFLTNEEFEKALDEENVRHTRDIFGNIVISRDEDGNIIYNENTIFHRGNKTISTNIAGDRGKHNEPRIKVRTNAGDDVIILSKNEGEFNYEKMKDEYKKRKTHANSKDFNYIKGYGIFAHKEIWNNKENHSNDTEETLSDLARIYDNLDDSFRKQLISVGNSNMEYKDVKSKIDEIKDNYYEKKKEEN